MSPRWLKRERPIHFVPVPNATTTKSELQKKKNQNFKLITWLCFSIISNVTVSLKVRLPEFINILGFERVTELKKRLTLRGRGEEKSGQYGDFASLRLSLLWQRLIERKHFLCNSLPPFVLFLWKIWRTRRRGRRKVNFRLSIHSNLTEGTRKPEYRWENLTRIQ